jgi:ATP-binding cassette subfamily D (ALD) protein 3
MLLVAFSLLGRTYADVWMITNTTKIEAYVLLFVLLLLLSYFSGVIDRDPKFFMKFLVQYLLAMPAISVINNMLKVECWILWIYSKFTYI